MIYVKYFYQYLTIDGEGILEEIESFDEKNLFN
jgi:hypothetical protein